MLAQSSTSKSPRTKFLSILRVAAHYAQRVKTLLIKLSIILARSTHKIRLWKSFMVLVLRHSPWNRSVLS
uniref:Uncharacterized protein n=1 Tax=Arundo donax TaxID=35708 RepID=A0A0A8XPD8_ARUDO